MEVIVGKTAGFCFGVKNAVTKAQEELNKEKKVYCLGELVHNKQVTEKLMNEGMHFIDDIKDAENSIIIRSHGVNKQTYNQIKERKLNVIDLTCPKVLHIHNIAEEYSEKGYFIILVGKKEHPEIIGTISFCGENSLIIEDDSQVKIAIKEYLDSNKKNLLVIAQTTFSMEKFNSIVNKIKEKVSNVEIKNTICNATKERQEETEKIAKNVDIMVIVGGKHSSNSNKLYEIAKKYCKIVCFVETENEIESEDFNGINKVGIMAGASTPQESIQKVVEKIRKVW